MASPTKCPSEDPFYDLKPLDLSCPLCGSEYNVFSDELVNRHHKCRVCGGRIVEVALLRDSRVWDLLDFVRSLGVTDVALLGVDRITVDDRFRDQCEEPRCPNYDSCINCPPYSPTPAWFRDHIKRYIHVLAFKFDMPVEAVQSEKRREAGRLLHETTAIIEHQAQSMGFERASGYSSGGCKRTLCFEHAECAAVQEGGECRNPDIARPSLSGMGVNWNDLSKALGWAMRNMDDEAPNSDTPTVMMAGLVFLE